MIYQSFPYDYSKDYAVNFWNYLNFCKYKNRNLYDLLNQIRYHNIHDSMLLREKIIYLQQKQEVFKAYQTSYSIFKFQKYDYKDFVLALASSTYDEYNKLESLYDNKKVFYKTNKPCSKFIKNYSNLKKEKKKKSEYYYDKFSKDKYKNIKRFKSLNKKEKVLIHKKSRRMIKKLIYLNKDELIHECNLKLIDKSKYNW